MKEWKWVKTTDRVLIDALIKTNIPHDGATSYGVKWVPKWVVDAYDLWRKLDNFSMSLTEYLVAIDIRNDDASNTPNDGKVE